METKNTNGNKNAMNLFGVILISLLMISPVAFADNSTNSAGGGSSGGSSPTVIAIPVPANRAPVISGTGGPTNINVNEQGTWSITASDPENGPLVYYVVWGDEGRSGYPTVQTLSTSQAATFQHTYSSAGTYTIKFTVVDALAAQAQSTITVNVNSAGKADLAADMEITVDKSNTDNGNTFVTTKYSAKNIGTANSDSFNFETYIDGVRQETSAAYAPPISPGETKSLGSTGKYLSPGWHGAKFVIMPNGPDASSLNNIAEKSFFIDSGPQPACTKPVCQSGEISTFFGYDPNNCPVYKCVPGPQPACTSDYSQIYATGTTGTGGYSVKLTEVGASGPNYAFFDVLNSEGSAIAQIQVSPGTSYAFTAPNGDSLSISVCSTHPGFTLDAKWAYVRLTLKSAPSANKAPTISGVKGDTNLAAGQTGTWAVTASDPENGPLSYAVVWGDENYYKANGKALQSSQQTATFTHVYYTAGYYNPTFYVKDDQSQTAQASLSVNVGSQPCLVIDCAAGSNVITTGYDPNNCPVYKCVPAGTADLAFNGGSASYSDNQVHAQYVIKNIGNAKSDGYMPVVYIDSTDLNYYNYGYTGLDAGASQAVAYIEKAYQLPSGWHNLKIAIKPYGPDANSDNNYMSQDFYVQPTITLNKPPVISSTGGPTSINVGETGTWTISASDPENGALTYSIAWGDENSGYPQGRIDKVQSQTGSFTHIYYAAGTYTVSFTVADDQGQQTRSSITVNVGKGDKCPAMAVQMCQQGYEQYNYYDSNGCLVYGCRPVGQAKVDVSASAEPSTVKLYDSFKVIGKVTYISGPSSGPQKFRVVTTYSPVQTIGVAAQQMPSVAMQQVKLAASESDIMKILQDYFYGTKQGSVAPSSQQPAPAPSASVSDAAEAQKTAVAVAIDEKISADFGRIDYVTLQPGESTSVSAYFTARSTGQKYATVKVYTEAVSCTINNDGNGGSGGCTSSWQLVGSSSAQFSVVGNEQPPSPPSEGTIKLYAGWNMVSVPVGTTVSMKDVSSQCDSKPYAWRLAETGYVKEYTLSPGVGYWIKSNGNCDFAVAKGSATQAYAVPALFAGWNLVAAPESATSISDYAGTCKITAGPWYYSYDSASERATPQYVYASSLEPGKAYWVNAAASCTLGTGSDTPPAPPAGSTSSGGSQ